MPNSNGAFASKKAGGMESSFFSSFKNECSVFSIEEGGFPKARCEAERENFEDSSIDGVVDGAMCIHVESGVSEVHSEVEDHNDDESSIHGIVNEKLSNSTESEVEGVCGGADDQNSIVADDFVKNVNEHDVCDEQDPVDCERELEERNTVPRKRERLRKLERLALQRRSEKQPHLDHMATKRRNSASKQQHYFLLLQERLEKIYHRERMIESMDRKMKIWMNSKNTGNDPAGDRISQALEAYE